VNLQTGENHPGTRPRLDGSCTGCHDPEGPEFSEAITGAHTIPTKSTQLKGVNLEIVSLANAEPGETLEVTFKVTDNTGQPIAPADMDYLAVTLAGAQRTSDYVNRVTETIFRAPSETSPAVEEAGEGTYRYTFEYSLPDDASGTYAVGLEGYVMETISGLEDPVRVAGFNPVTYVALGGGEPEPRRQVISNELCNACHKDLALHGGMRQNTEYCVACHNPTASDEEVRPEEALPPTSIHFKVLIHRLHRGEDRAQKPYIVYGFQGSTHDFTELRFPGNLADCETCHLPGTYTLPLPEGVQPTTVRQGNRTVNTTLPIRSACTACHDSEAVAGHAELETTSRQIEACEVCHGPGSEFDVASVHRQ
jgi:OmcA/MtrC family decaheme c-type cytochrome